MNNSNQVLLGLSLGTHPLVGIAALPLLDILRDQDAIVLKRVLGTGQGALSAALIANHKSEQEIRNTLKAFYKDSFYNKFNKSMAMTILNFGPSSYHPSQSFFSGDGKHQFFDQLFGKERVEDQEISLTLVATDLYTAESVRVTEGLLSSAVYGASAWFPFHPPSQHQGRLLVSGGFSEAIPTINDSLLDLEIVISVHDNTSWKHSDNASDGWAFFERAFQTLESKRKSLIRKRENTHIIPLRIDLDKPIPFSDISDSHLDYVYSLSEKVLQHVLSSQ